MAKKPTQYTNSQIVQQAVTAGEEGSTLSDMIRSKVAGLAEDAKEVALAAIRKLCRCEGVEGGKVVAVAALPEKYRKAYSAITSVTSRMTKEAKAAAAKSPEGKAAAAAAEAAAKVTAEAAARKLFSRSSFAEVLGRFQPHVIADESYSVRDRVTFKAMFDQIAKTK